MKNEKITLSSDNWDKFYENEGSRYFKLESEVLAAFGEDQKTLFYKVFESTTKLIQIIGVVAGFGFTGLGYVEHRSLFVVGEFFLLIAIFTGLLWTQRIYRLNLKSADKEVQRVKQIFAKRYSAFKLLYDKALSDIKSGKDVELSKSLLNNLTEENDTLLKKFAQVQKKQDDWDPLLILMVLFAAGSVGILLSFITF
jgi:hypothetical protein